MAIAAGDKLRLYRRTDAQIDGRRGSIGNNGDIVEVLARSRTGLVLRNERGLVGDVEWRRITDKETGRLLLGIGRAFTIDAVQGMSTKGEHINALTRGTGAASAFKTYTAESRATGQTHTMLSKAAVLGAVHRSRALGDVTPITDEELWERVATDTSAKPYKALAIDLAAEAKKAPAETIDQVISSHHRMEAGTLSSPQLGRDIRAAFEAGAAREAFARRREVIEDLLQRAGGALKDSAGLRIDHINALRAALRPNDGSARDSASSDALSKEPTPRRSSPSPGP